MRLSSIRVITLFLIAAAGHQLAAKDKNKQIPQDRITVAAHLALPGGPILRFVATRHFDRSYIYAERGPGQPTTLLDVTNPNRPVVVSEMPSTGGAATLIAASGTAAIATSAPAVSATAPQTIRVMDFSDAAHPKVTQQFENVTAVERVSGSITLLSNPDGVWVLTQQLAADPQEEERYARKVIYGDSMY